MLFRSSYVRCLGYRGLIRCRGSFLRSTENLLLNNHRSVTSTGPEVSVNIIGLANDSLTSHNGNNNWTSFTSKHTSHFWITPTTNYHATHRPCIHIPRNCSKIRSFSTHSWRERNTQRHTNVNKSNRQLGKYRKNTIEPQSPQHTVNTGTIKPRRLKRSIIAAVLLSEAGGKSGEISSDGIDGNYKELDHLLEAADPDNDECTFSDSESEENEELAELDSDSIADNIDYVEEIDLGVERDDDDNDEGPAPKENNDGFRGIPDPTVPISDTPCSGCGALLHCQNTGIPGYMPSQRFIHFTKHHPSKLRLQTCQRCYLMNTHNLALKVSVTPDDYRSILSKIRDVQALVIVVVDVMDMPNSIFPNITDLIGKKRPLYIVGNKTDLLPQDAEGYLRRVKEVLIQQCDEAGLTTGSYIKHVGLVSAKTGFGIEELTTRLLTDWARKGHVYILGCTNVGKSSLFNALLSSDMCNSSAVDFINRATTSIWPGTTLNLLKFPLTNPEPWKLARRMKRLKRQKTAEQEERQFLQMKYRERDASNPAKYPTLMGHIGRTFEGTRNMAVGEEDSKSWSGPTFSFDSDSGDIRATGKIDREQMEGFVYEESRFAKSRWCYDTPGVISDNQILTELTQHELSVVLTQRTIVPRTYILKPGEAMHVSGLARIDYIAGVKSVYFTVFAARAIPIAVRKIFEMDDFYKRHVGTRTMGVPLGDAARLARLPALVGKNMTLVGEEWDYSIADIILSSIGWVAVTPGPGLDADLRVYTPGGRGCILRKPALLPYAIKLRGKRTRSAAYQMKPLRLFNRY